MANTILPSRNYGCRLVTQGTLLGMRTVVLENPSLRVTVLADKGTDIYEFLYKPLDIDFMWRSPMGLRNPATTVPSSSGSLGFWYDFYEGGWQEIIPSGGPSSTYKGAEFGLHGESSTIPWDFAVVEDSPERVSVKFWVRTYRSPFYLEKTLSLSGEAPVLEIEETLVNEAEEEMELMWGHHPALGANFLDEHCIIDIPARTGLTGEAEYFPSQRVDTGITFAWPLAPARKGGEVDLSRVPSPANKTADVFFLTDLEQGWYGITNTEKEVGFGLVWPKEVFTSVWMWQVCRGSYGYPWYGRTYNMALEPWTGYPGDGIADAVERGSSLKLGPGASQRVALKALVYTGRERVREIRPDGTVVRSSGN
jgi:hypothetical protein